MVIPGESADLFYAAVEISSQNAAQNTLHDRKTEMPFDNYKGCSLVLSFHASRTLTLESFSLIRA